MRTSLVFIHGRYAQSGAWLKAIDEGLAAAGRDALTEDLNVVEVDYTDVLNDVLASLPPTEIPAHEPWPHFHRHQHMVRGAMHPFTTRPRTLFDFFPKEWVAWFLVNRMPEIYRYWEQPEVRAAVRARCLEQMPDGDVIVVAHSLGSVVAYDLLHYLPRSTHIELLLSIGSPMARRYWREALGEFQGRFPTATVTTWINLVSTGDWVTAGDGVHRYYPHAIDTYARLGLGLHGETHYLASEPAGVAIGDAITRASARTR